MFSITASFLRGPTSLANYRDLLYISDNVQRTILIFNFTSMIWQNIIPFEARAYTGVFVTENLVYATEETANLVHSFFRVNSSRITTFVLPVSLNAPNGIAVDEGANILYVTTKGTHQLWSFNKTSKNRKKNQENNKENNTEIRLKYH